MARYLATVIKSQKDFVPEEEAVDAGDAPFQHVQQLVEHARSPNVKILAVQVQ